MQQIQLQVIILASAALLMLLSTTCEARNVRSLMDDHSSVQCPPETFYNVEQSKCSICSECRINQIITSPCHDNRDTQCGPFYDYKTFIPAEALPPWNPPPYKPTKEDLEQLNDDSTESEEQEQTNMQSNGASAKNTVNPSASDDSEWRSLTTALAIIISVFVVIIAIIIVATCFIRRKYLNERDSKIVYSYTAAPIVEVNRTASISLSQEKNEPVDV